VESATTDTPRLESYFSASANMAPVLSQSNEEEALLEGGPSSMSVDEDLPIADEDNRPTAGAATSAATSASAPSDVSSSDHELICLDMSTEYPTDRTSFPSRVSNFWTKL